MDLLEKLVKVSIGRVDVGSDSGSPASCSAIDGDVTLHPRQSVRFRLTVCFDAEGEEKSKHAVAFLSQLGEARLEEAWSLLFNRLTLSPFLLSGRAAAVVCASDATDDGDDDDDDESGTGSSSHTEVPDVSATHRATLPSLSFGGLTPTAASSHPAVPSPPREGGAVVAFGAPDFWLGRWYQGAGEVGSPAESDRGLAPSGVAGEDCLVAGPAVTVGCVETVVTPAGTAEAASVARRLSIPSAMVLPRSMSSHYEFDYMVPDEALWESRAGQDLPRALAFVLLIPLHGACVGGGDGTLTTSDTHSEDDYYVLRRVLSRSFVDPMSSWFPANYAFSAVPLGCCYVPVHLPRALACESVAYPLSNDQLLLSLNVTNVTSAPVRLQSISLDLYSTHAAHAPPSLPYWGATRPATQGHDRRLIDLLTKLVTVTPMIVSQDRPPCTLQAEETYAFQCILQVVPEFNYVLNPSSLEHVYQRLCQESDAAGASAAGAGGAGPLVVQPGQTTSATSTAMRDDDGVLVTTEDVVKVMAGAYQSYLFVYYHVMEDGGASSTKVDSPVVSGLHLRHPVQWSFSV